MTRSRHSMRPSHPASWMEESMICHATEAVVESGMVIFMHMILVDSARRLTVSLGETGIVHVDRFEPVSSASHDLVVKQATEVARSSPHARAGRIGAPPPVRVRLMRPKTMIRLVALNATPSRNAGV